jgi:hypothetical protein
MVEIQKFIFFLHVLTTAALRERSKARRNILTLLLMCNMPRGAAQILAASLGAILVHRRAHPWLLV